MLELIHIGKRFASQTVLQNIDLKICEGEFFSLLGSSGCGKTTLLRIIAGLEFPSQGEILLAGKRINSLPIQERPFNLVFQKYALFPHRNVWGNIAFGLELKKISKKEIENRVEEALNLVGLFHFKERMPETLSGGQQQRVALARAIVNRPKILLLDEPLSALDQKLREQMRAELRALQKRLGLTFIFVTHDQEEAMVLSDRIAVMNKGMLEQVGSPRELYEEPASAYLADFIGESTEISGVFRGKENSLMKIEISQNDFLKVSSSSQLSPGEKVKLFLRPECIQVFDDSKSLAKVVGKRWDNSFTGEVIASFYKGFSNELQVGINGVVKFRIVIGNDPILGSKRFAVGEKISFGFSAEDIHLFKAESPEGGTA